MYRIRFEEEEHAYFLGIGDRHLAELAMVLAENGLPVSASERRPSMETDALANAGITLYYGVNANHITEAIDYAVISPSIQDTNTLYLALTGKNIPCLSVEEFEQQLSEACGDEMEDSPEVGTSQSRQFALKGSIGGITIVDDSARTPEQLTALMNRAAGYPHSRLICIFRPYADDLSEKSLPIYKEALSRADIILLTDSYGALYSDTSVILLAELSLQLRKAGKECPEIKTFDEIENYVLANCTMDDLLITCGAGDVAIISENLLGL